MSQKYSFLSQNNVKQLFIFASLFIIASCQTTKNDVAEITSTNKKPHNIIYLIGDGMGIAHVTGYRYYKANKDKLIRGDNHIIEPTEFDNILVGMAATYPADNTLVTDSASSATALATGVKSYNGAIGVDKDKLPKESILEKAQKFDMLTGIIATAQINHATPASFIAHIDNRHKYNEIADQYIEGHDTERPPVFSHVDLMLGGGTKYYIREDRNIVKEYQAKGYSYVDKISDLSTLQGLPALGLFAKKGLPFAIDSKQPNRLTAMTKTALRLLNNKEKGFFLMVEASQIDWCSHGNDIACSMAEMADFEATLSVVLDYAKKEGNTTVVVTADHSTGGLALGRDKAYVWHAELIHKIGISADKFSSKVMDGKKSATLWQKHVDLPITEAELFTLETAAKTKDKAVIHKAFVNLTSLKTATGWTTGGHTAEDVQVFAYGPYRDKFVGYQDNTDIALKLFDILEMNK